MNKYLILLGLVLLVSLSLARDTPENWMQSVEGRYSCAYEYNFDLLDLIGPGCKMLSEGEYLDAIDTYFENKNGMLGAVDNMIYYAGCDGDPVSVPNFRSGMLTFNTNSAAFRQIFLTNLRGCLAGTIRCDCDREDILEGMGIFNSAYRSCLAGEGYPPFCREPEEGGEEEA